MGRGGSRDAHINTSLIRTINGQAVTLYHDTKLPRPYDLIGENHRPGTNVLYR
jgi:hypothetical protein